MINKTPKVFLNRKIFLEWRVLRFLRKHWILNTKDRGMGQDERWVRFLWKEPGAPNGGKCVAVYEDEL